MGVSPDLIGDNFRLVAIGVLDRLESRVTGELSVVGSGVTPVGSSASPVAIFWGGSHILAEKEYLGREYKERLVEYPIFHVQLLKRCLQEVASSVFGCLNTFFTIDFIINRLKGTEHRDWLMLRSSLHRAIINNELQRPSLVEVVTNIVCVWPLIVSYLKEPDKETDGDNSVV